MRKTSLLSHCLTSPLRIRQATSGANTSILLRDFIHDSLYSPRDGYFARSRSPVGCLAQPLDFAALLGRSAYQRALSLAYRELKVAWLTPSEIFSPHYGRAVAAYLLQEGEKRSQQSIKIVEVGGGTGTLAKDVLDYLKQVTPAHYAECTYTTWEISRALATSQQRRLEAAGHGKCFSSGCCDATSSGGRVPPHPEHHYILGMEVLDNCGHDKLIRASDGSWMAEHITQNEHGNLVQKYQMSQDPWIATCLNAASGLQPSHPSILQRAMMLLEGVREETYQQAEAIFLPTKACMMIASLVKSFPSHSVLLADFHALPDVKIQGKNAPLVAATIDGVTEDFNTYLLPHGTADIFFPTDFQLLQSLFHIFAGTKSCSKIMKHSSFMREYADIGQTTAMNGYNPMVEDYANSSFFIGSTC